MGDNAQLLVSVIINFYNGEKYLCEAIDSVFSAGEVQSTPCAVHFL